MKILQQCFIVLACLAIAELILYCVPIHFPSSLLGMILLTAALKFKIVKLEWVKDIADFLLAHLGLFFVPPAVAVMLYFDLIRAQWIPIVLSMVVSMILVLVATGWTYQLIRRKK